LRESHLDVAETLGKEHGRRVHRRLQSSNRLAEHLNWPGVAQVCRLVRTTKRNSEETTEIEYAITSAPRTMADARQLLAWWRGHWGIENRSHYVRDVTFGEDQSRVRTDSAPQAFSAFRNAAITLLRRCGCINIASALRQNSYQPQKIFAMLGILKQ